MGRNNLKFAVYLDEIDDDPSKACEVLSHNDVTSVCLRRAWTRDISAIPDEACSRLLDLLQSNGLDVVLLATSIGSVPPETLSQCEQQLDRALAVCNYFKCKAIRVFIGKPSDPKKASKLLDAWLDLVSAKSLSANVAPSFELSLSLPVIEPAGLASLLNKHKRWSVIYDPAVLIMQRKMDPFTRYWSLLKQKVSHFDIHDFLIGKSPRPPGHGDAKLDLTLADAIGSGYRGWYCLEPGMGRR